MSRPQFAFVIGFLFVGVWVFGGFLAAVGAVAAGLLCYAVARVLDGEVDLAGLADRFAANRRSSSRSPRARREGLA